MRKDKKRAKNVRKASMLMSRALVVATIVDAERMLHQKGPQHVHCASQVKSSLRQANKVAISVREERMLQEKALATASSVNVERTQTNLV